MKNANPVSPWAVLAGAILVLAAAGCGSGKTADASSTKTIFDHFTVEVGGHAASLQFAVLPDEQERGLMQRGDLGRDEGMIFVSATPRRQSFWMKNTPEPLDIGFADAEGTIEEIYPLYPYDMRTVSSHGDQLRYAIEMPQGWFAVHGIRPGATIDLKAVSSALRDRGFDPAKYGFKPD